MNQKKFELHKTVVQCLWLKLIEVSELNKHKEITICGIKLTTVPSQTIKTLLRNQSASSIKIIYKILDVSKEQSSKITTVHSQISLPKPTPAEILKYPTLRELEDALTERSLSEHKQTEHEQEISAQNGEIDWKVIQHQFDPEVKKFFPIEYCFNLFRNTEGFADLFNTILETYHKGSHTPSKNRFRGLLFEVSTAYHLATTNNEKIIAFSKKLESNYEGADFDIETLSGKLIECKISEIAITNKDQIKNQIKKKENSNISQ